MRTSGVARALLSIALLSLSVPLQGCARVSGWLPAPEPAVATGEFRVGAARVDITPMPGYPMGGMGVGGKIARGVWTRLHARAIAFEDADGNGMVLVSCDLWAIPGGLADRVAELVATEYAAPRLGREQIVLAATHTHHSPGNFSTCMAYNTAASLKPGFDRRLFDFLAHRIASGIGEAWRNRRPAALVRNERPVGGVGRNRSLKPFLANGEAALELIRENARLPVRVTAFPVGGEDAYRALDPTLTVIRAEAVPRVADAAPLAAVAFYAVHPTAMGSVTEVYNSDIFGIAAAAMERELGGAVVALFNGAEGDVAPNWDRPDRPSALELAGLLAGGLRQLLREPGEDITGPIRYAYTTSSLEDLAEPMGSAAQLAGSEGDWTFLRSAGWREGLREDDPERRIEGQGAKMDPLAREVLIGSPPFGYSLATSVLMDFPKRFGAGVYRLGSATLATLPGEFTTMLGRRIASSVARAARTEDRVLLVGLANEYLSYFTTEAEYALQHYEGGSTLFGPRSGAKIEGLLVELAADATDGKSPRREERIRYRHKAGFRERFGVKELGLLGHTERLGDTFFTLSSVLMDGTTMLPTPNNPHFVWVDRNPRWPGNPRSPHSPTPRVGIEAKTGSSWGPLLVAGLPENDEGLGFVTTVVASLAGTTRWITIWMVPDQVDEHAELRFVVSSTGGGTLRSPSFTVVEARESWGFVGLADARRANGSR